MKTLNLLLLFVFTFCGIMLSAQEICDNGVDDDGDGLIDLNDDDCVCQLFIESSLIPNPSFEEMTCCPTANAMLDCAVGWIQASGPTTDYVHLCGGYTGNTSIPAFAPEPFADGEGAVGFRDGQSQVGANYKEYVGACLTETMIIGTEYRLDFHVGFQDNVQGSLGFDLALFGATDCSFLPFGGNSSTIGCPSNTGNFDQLVQISVTGNNEWVNTVIDFTATKEYNVLVIGPACAANPNVSFDPYFYVDGLNLAEVSEFGFPVNESGSICQNNLTFDAEDDGNSTFQWYKDGIAISGATGSTIVLGADIPNVEGIYTVVITTEGNCSLSKAYEVRIPPYYAQFEETICESEFIVIGTDTLYEPGYYEITIPALDGCDSIVQFTLDVDPTTIGMLQDYICAGETYELYDIVTNEPGNYSTIIMNSVGCDSILNLELLAISETGGVDVDPLYEMELGTTINIIPNSFDPALVDFVWTTSSGQIVSDTIDILNFQPIDDMFLYLASTDEFGCLVLDTVEIRVDKENIRMFVPNIFTPNNDGVNDFFRFYTTIAVDEVSKFVIYDRWGEKVFEDENISVDDNYRGWNGQFKNRKAASGVYAYYIQASFLDGTEQLIKGDVTLIR